MKGSINLGGFSLDLPRLIETRLLIQANSGGGKSWCIRKLLEETHGKVQHIVLDMEGEFATLREKFDYVLAGKGHEIPADPRSAELLARKILELQASLIVDLYELKHHERIRFVKLFLEALVNAPKELWHEVLVVIDEAHVFAPEKGQAESLGSVIDLASRGRKRGFCAVLATQRLSKLHKDAAAECNNKLIGRTGLDVDVKRAVEELGFTAKDGIKELRSLEPGEFFSFGPALSREVVKVKIGQVETKHPKAGQRLGMRAPAPTAKVKHILGKLTDLPKEAEEELRDKAALQTRVRELERELRAKPAPAAVGKEEIEKVKKKCFEESRNENAIYLRNSMKTLTGRINKLLDDELDELKKILPQQATIAPITRATPSTYNVSTPSPSRTRVPPKSDNVSTEGKDFGRCERMILKFLAMRAGSSFTNVQVAALTGYASGSGGFNNALSKLSQAGLIVRDQGRLAVNDEAIPQIQEILGTDFSAAGQHSLEDWLNKLGKCEREIYRFLLAEPDTAWTKEALGERTGYTPGSGGFNNALSRLNTLGLIKRSCGQVQLNHEIVGI